MIINYLKKSKKGFEMYHNTSVSFCHIMDGGSGDNGVLVILGTLKFSLSEFLKKFLYSTAFMKMACKDMIHR